MREDEEGFLYPSVDAARCIQCGLCEKVCPITHAPILSDPPAVYAAKHKSDAIKLKSSSGGMFSALAQFVLQEGGVVFGAAFDQSWNVCHQYVERAVDLDKLRRSKYVQSDIGQSFKQAKEFLDQNRWVLFTGTPCQIAGLKNYLNRDYEHLLTADIICHGVPSPGVWRKFLQERFPRPGISAIDFRDKSIAWDASYLSVVYQNRKMPSLPKCLLPLRKVFLARRAFLFRKIFKLPYGVSNLYERPSCYQCRFKGQHRSSDFTLGDLWGVLQIAPNMYDKKGVSVLFVNTLKGRKIFEKLQSQLSWQPVAAEQALAYNPLFSRSVEKNPYRSAFFAHYRKEPLTRLMRRIGWQKVKQRLWREKPGLQEK